MDITNVQKKKERKNIRCQSIAEEMSKRVGIKRTEGAVEEVHKRAPLFSTFPYGVTHIIHPSSSQRADTFIKKKKKKKHTSATKAKPAANKSEGRRERQMETNISLGAFLL